MSTTNNQTTATNLPVPDRITGLVKKYNRLAPGNKFNVQMYEREYTHKDQQVVEYYGIIYEKKRGDSKIVSRTADHSQQEDAEDDLEALLKNYIKVAESSPR